MQIFLTADHNGFQLKNVLFSYLKEEGHQVSDLGPDVLDEADDYPDYAFKLGEAVAGEAGSMGIAVCGSGVGMAVAAGKVPGIRASMVHEVAMARAAREDDNLNVLSLGADHISDEEAKEVVKAWLETPFTNEERHVRRIEKISSYENG